MRIHSRYLAPTEAKLQFFQYPNGNTAMLFSDSTTGEPLVKVTLNHGGIITKDEVCIKVYSENEGIEACLWENGLIGEDPVNFSRNLDPIYRLTEKAIAMRDADWAMRGLS